MKVGKDSIRKKLNKNGYKFDNNKICYVKIKGKEKTLYLTVKYQNGYCISEDKYPNPASFN